MDSSDMLLHASARRENRQFVVQFLYAWELNPQESIEGALKALVGLHDRKEDHFAFAKKMIEEILKNLANIDEEIKTLSEGWHFSRIQKVDLAILRLSIYELKFCYDVPAIVVINEAIELSKLYSGEDSKRFINGILDCFLKKLQDRPKR